MADLQAGDTAPDFSAPDQDGKVITLKSLKGKNVILYFYPKDDTPGCTKESCGFRDNHKAAGEINTVVLGVSADSVASHKKFAEKFDLPFSLLADESKAIIEAYGAWGEKTSFGKTSVGIIRTTCVIGPNGKVIWYGKGSGTEEHAQEMLKQVKA